MNYAEVSQVSRLFARLLRVGLMMGLVGSSSLALAAGPKKVLRLRAVKVQGTLQKPQAFYILQRSNVSFEVLDAKQSFITKIVTSIDEKPF